MLLLLLPSAAATCCCCDVACFLLFSFASSCSPSGAFACSSFSLLRLLPWWGLLSSLSCGIKKAKQGSSSQQQSICARSTILSARSACLEKGGPLSRRALARYQISAAGIGATSSAAPLRENGRSVRPFPFTRSRVQWRDLTSNRGQSHRAADEEASLRTAVREEGASEEQRKALRSFLTSVRPHPYACRHANGRKWVELSAPTWALASQIGESNFAGGKKPIKNIRGRYAIANPAPHRTTASDIFNWASFLRTVGRSAAGAPVGSSGAFTTTGLVLLPPRRSSITGARGPAQNRP